MLFLSLFDSDRIFTRDEALDLLKSGKPIRCKNWWWGRFIQVKGQAIVDEKGTPFSEDEILATASGWTVYNPRKDAHPG